MADAAYAILTRRSDRVTGNFFIDDEVLLSEVGAGAWIPFLAPRLDSWVGCW
jgi:hypothetical protein